MTEYRGDPRAKRLVEHLLKLARTADDRSDSRAALAELRQATQNPLRGAKHVAPALGPDERSDEPWFYLVASLFAWHRGHAEGQSLGKAFRAINDDSGSIERRFLQILASDSDHLPDHLRHAVRLLASRGIPLDWYRLANDLLGWDYEGKPKQHGLARDFYSTSDNNDAAEAASTPSEETL